MIQPLRQLSSSRPPAAAIHRPLTIDLWSNAVAGGWEPGDLETGLGGSEEALVLWAGALAERGHRVRVYHTPRGPAASQSFREAEFLSRSRFDPFSQRDVLVTWKCPHPWRIGAEAGLRIHWSSDAEPPWPERWTRGLDAFVTLTPFHRQTMPWLAAKEPARPPPVHEIPHGVDLAHLERNQAEKEPALALYASSPDRGLEPLLRDWPRLRAAHPGLRLEVCYGWRRFMACLGTSPVAARFRRDMDRLLAQPGITYRGQVSQDDMARAYWRAQYWMLPLQRAESELFCLNAVKAIHCGATAVVHPIGALQHTATRRIDYTDFLRGETAPRETSGITAQDWRAIVGEYWEPLFWKQTCKS